MKCYVHRNHKKNIKTKLNRKLETLQQLSHQFSRNIYKTNMEYRICSVWPLQDPEIIRKQCKTNQTRTFDIRQQRFTKHVQSLYKINEFEIIKNT